MKILVTGFDPFGGEAINPAWEAVSRLPKEIEGAEIVTVQIPTVFGDSAKRLFEAVEQHQPHAVVCVGQAGGRFGITPERVANNLWIQSFKLTGRQPTLRPCRLRPW